MKQPAHRAPGAIVAALLALLVVAPTAVAQVRRNPPAPPARGPYAPPPAAAPRTNPSAPRIGYAGTAAPQQSSNYGYYRDHRGFPRYQQPVVIYYPVPVAYVYVPSGCGASVCDVNGNRVMRGFDDPYEQGEQMSPATVPDLSGSPYVVLDGGVMKVDFGNGDRRTVASCAAQQSAMTPDGQPRTIFYAPAADGLVLRSGQRGNVLGTPPAGAAICYGLDQYGRVTLIY